MLCQYFLNPDPILQKLLTSVYRNGTVCRTKVLVGQHQSHQCLSCRSMITWALAQENLSSVWFRAISAPLLFTYYINITFPDWVIVQNIILRKVIINQGAAEVIYYKISVVRLWKFCMGNPVRYNNGKYHIHTC